MGSVSKDKTPINVAIIGGGIGGLALSIGLQQYSHINVRIFEAAPRFFELGGKPNNPKDPAHQNNPAIDLDPPAGVLFGANAIRAMSLIHPAIGEAYARISTTAGWPSKESTYFDFILGQDLDGQPAGTPVASPPLSAAERHSAAHRARLIDELARLVPEASAEFSKRLVGLARDEAPGARTRMAFADGVTYEADAVIGCDGLRSVCRDFVLGGDDPLARPVFTGKYAYRGLVPMHKAVAAIGPEKARNRYVFLGSGGHVLVFPVAGGAVMNVVAVGTAKDGTWQGSWIKPMKREDIEADFKDFGEDCQKILSLMENTSHWGIYDLSPDIPTFTSAPLRLLLLGDSAHACAPHLGAGAGQALEDAHVLSHLLGACRSADDVLAAFAAYESVRRPRTRFVQCHSRRQGELLDLHADGVGEDLHALRAVLSGPIREIWNCDLEAELAKAQAKMAELLAEGGEAERS
ncbi:mannitol 1-phosphate dehydrogenase [Cordyceps militaris CM01]|uniref:Mannitol 1-phosphate dehydrogenase n=1 Tax=Cordyceps militaris (strain CM01) TaxID=983644 RepID=G3JJG6_CORMM|nr:mannitol 1-phosphate dehydrogenase [Cordyceps militaris CM01]EGX92054.1 mannitol 1-phosphate dehydrogenase [Cordyceps militaris CM01]